MTHAGPLPGMTPAPRPFGVPGVFAGVVERLDPLGVSVPALTGLAQVVPQVAQVPGLVLGVGDRVWVSCINGDRRQLVVVAGARTVHPAVPDTTGATLPDLETEVNTLKGLLRSAGLLTPAPVINRVTQTLYAAQTPTSPNNSDAVPLVLGLRFVSDIGGTIPGVRVYRATTPPTSLIGLLYSAGGAELAQATISSPAVGWNTATFTTPVAVTAGVTYTAAYFSSIPYVSSAAVLPLSNGHLSAAGGSSYYLYAGAPGYPTNAAPTGVAYFVDPILSYIP